jgi:hypothetical protein
MGVMVSAVVALVMLSAGCSGNGATEDVVSPPVQPTSTPVVTTPAPRPSLAPLTVEQAATKYLAAVRPRNSALAKFDADWKASASIETLRLDAALIVAAERHFLTVLDNNVWPPSIAENADSLAFCVGSSISWYDATTRMTSTAQIKAPPACGASDAQLIRIRLQLPGY